MVGVSGRSDGARIRQLWHFLTACCLAVASLPLATGHLSALCTVTHEQRPHSVTFLFGTYHKSPNAGAATPGTAFVRSPRGTTRSFPFEDFCAVPHDGSSAQVPDPAWPLDANVSLYRERLRQNCVCSQVLGCGDFDTATQMCSSAEGDCATVDPFKASIECFGQNDDVPSSVSMAWTRPLADDESGNCAYGAATGEEFPSWIRTWYAFVFAGVRRQSHSYYPNALHITTVLFTALRRRPVEHLDFFSLALVVCVSAGGLWFHRFCLVLDPPPPTVGETNID